MPWNWDEFAYIEMARSPGTWSLLGRAGGRMKRPFFHLSELAAPFPLFLLTSCCPPYLILIVMEDTFVFSPSPQSPPEQSSS